MNTMFKFWTWIKGIAEEKIKENYLKPNGGCNSACPRCKQWESSGNLIFTEPLEDGSDKRTCENCGNEWLAIFTPAGFIPIENCAPQEQTK